MSPRSAPKQKAPRTMHVQRHWAKNWCSAPCHRRSSCGLRSCSAPKTTSSTGLRPSPVFPRLFPSSVAATPGSSPSLPGTSPARSPPPWKGAPETAKFTSSVRSEEHTSELQSLTNLVCRLLLEKKKNQTYQANLPRDAVQPDIQAER